MMLTTTKALALLALSSVVGLASAAQDARVDKFYDIASKNGGVVPLTTALYDELLHPSSPNARNYSTSVILTALSPKYGCLPCQAFDKAHKEVAKQWWNKNKKSKADQSRHFFAVLDFEKGQDVFRRLGLNTAPLGHLHLPSSGQAIQYDFQRSGPAPEAFASFMAQQTGLPITYTKPIDYSKIASAITIVLGAVTGCYFFWSYVKLFVFSRWLWAIGCLTFIIPMISGYMWNQIRKPPYMQMTREGQPSYIAGGFSNQFSVETQIISVVYGVLAFATYTLVVTLPNLSHNETRQKLGVYLWLGILAIMASVLVSIFRVKNPSYPFKLLF